MAGADGGAVRFFVDRTETQLLPGAGPPRVLVRIELAAGRGPLVQVTHPGSSGWVESPRTVSWLWDDHGEEVTQAQAAVIAASWGMTLPVMPDGRN